MYPCLLMFHFQCKEHLMNGSLYFNNLIDSSVCIFHLVGQASYQHCQASHCVKSKAKDAGSPSLPGMLNPQAPASPTPHHLCACAHVRGGGAARERRAAAVPAPAVAARGGSGGGFGCGGGGLGDGGGERRAEPQCDAPARCAPPGARRRARAPPRHPDEGWGLRTLHSLLCLLSPWYRR